MASPTQWTKVWASSRSWWWKESVLCCSPWGCKQLDMTEQLSWTDITPSTTGQDLQRYQHHRNQRGILEESILSALRRNIVLFQCGQWQKHPHTSMSLTWTPEHCISIVITRKNTCGSRWVSQLLSISTHTRVHSALVGIQNISLHNLSEAHHGKVHPKKCLSWAPTLLALVIVVFRALHCIKRAGQFSINEQSLKNNQKCDFLPLFIACDIKLKTVRIKDGKHQTPEISHQLVPKDEVD